MLSRDFHQPLRSSAVQDLTLVLTVDTSGFKGPWQGGSRRRSLLLTLLLPGRCRPRDAARRHEPDAGPG